MSFHLETTATTTQSTPVISVYWSLDATTSDSTNEYNGTLVNGATYFSTTNNQPYLAYGRGLTLISNSNQYMRVLSPYIDLSYRSFTIEAWIYSTVIYSGDYGIFSQCQCSTCGNQCLFFSVRASRLYAGFAYNDIYGTQNISNNVWYHVAFVYDYDAKQQILYVNGYQDTSKSESSPYQGVNGTIDIGSSVILSMRNYFNGYIDNVKLTTRAKSAGEILTIATLTGYFSFDGSSPYNDNGPNGFDGTQINAVVVAGRVNQGLRFTGSSSYFTAYGFYQAPYAVYTNRPFSVSLWINPVAISGATIVQFVPSLSSSSCTNFIGIWSPLSLTGQIAVQTYSNAYIVGPYVTINTWMHITATYSVTNGLRLYTNGVLFGNTGGYTQSASNYITHLVLGYVYSCYVNPVPNSGFQGTIDEVYVHSRELSQAEVSTLANP